MKTLSELRDNGAVNAHKKCTDVFDSNPDPIAMYKSGFDAGAKAVMDEAQNLVDTLRMYSNDNHTPSTNYTRPPGQAARNALNQWQKFKEGNDEPG